MRRSAAARDFVTGARSGLCRCKSRVRIFCLIFAVTAAAAAQLPRRLNGWLFGWLVGAFKPSKPQRITSGLRESFVKRYIVERTNNAELRPKEQSEKAKSCREDLWNEIELKGP